MGAQCTIPPQREHTLIPKADGASHRALPSPRLLLPLNLDAGHSRRAWCCRSPRTHVSPCDHIAVPSSLQSDSLLRVEGVSFSLEFSCIPFVHDTTTASCSVEPRAPAGRALENHSRRRSVGGEPTFHNMTASHKWPCRFSGPVPCLPCRTRRVVSSATITTPSGPSRQTRPGASSAPSFPCRASCAPSSPTCAGRGVRTPATWSERPRP